MLGAGLRRDPVPGQNLPGAQRTRGGQLARASRHYEFGMIGPAQLMLDPVAAGRPFVPIGVTVALHVLIRAAASVSEEAGTGAQQSTLLPPFTYDPNRDYSTVSRAR